MQSPFRRTLGAAALVTTAFGAAACGDVEIPSEQAPLVSLSPAEAPAHHQLARLVAFAMRDADVRASVHRSMQASEVKSGKLHLETFLRGDGTPLLDAMARAGGVAQGGIFELLAGSTALELYLPVQAHRDAWTGGADLIVATSLTETGAPYGVDLNGRPVQLSEDAPPSTPTLAIVPAESFLRGGAPHPSDRRRWNGPSFAMEAEPIDDGSGGGGSGGSTGTTTQMRDIGVQEYASHIRALDDHEPWWKDDAEFYVMFTGTTDVNGSALTKTINIPNVWTNDTGWKVLDPALKMFTWDTDYGTRVRVTCRERDGNSLNFNLKVAGNTELLGTTVSFEGSYTIDDGDDPCGEDYVTPRLSNGSWTMIPDGNPTYDGTSDLHWYGFGIQVGS